MLRHHIQTIELTAANSAVVFSNITQNYDDLMLLCSIRTNRTGAVGFIRPYINGSTSNQTVRRLFGNGSSPSSTVETNNWGLVVSSSVDTANTFSNSSLYIPNYRSSVNKSFSVDSVSENNGTQAFQVITAGLWADTAPVTSIQLIDADSTIAIGSTFSLYGIKRGSDGRTEVASGGAISFSGGYTIHTFNTSGTFVANRNLDVEYVVVGGGGGGSEVGGGAGGYRSSVSGELSGGGALAEARLTLPSGTSLPVVVGAGGPASTSQTIAGTNGSLSSLQNIFAIGGGGGAPRSSSGLTGGSGGGGGRIFVSGSTSGGPGTANQGHAGGEGTFQLNGAGGGGGGAGAVGQSGSSAKAGDGGAGIASSITGTSVARAGGGGACSPATAGTNGAGGLGGGGRGEDGNGGLVALPGTPNTGGGGGGTAGGSSNGAGGSGIVIIRYLTPA